MPSLKTYNLFISHSWAYSDAYKKLCEMLDAANAFSLKTILYPRMIQFTMLRIRRYMRRLKGKWHRVILY
jgi:hypothetical protein